MFYQNKIKVVPNLTFLKEFCTPLTLAIWFMDQGGKCNKADVLFHTNCFLKEEVQILQLMR
jgi:hypothetical protein